MAVVLAGVGVGVGIVGGLLLTRVMGRLLFGVRATDPVTFGVTALLLTGVAVLASALPAQRAVRADPMRVLKNE